MGSDLCEKAGVSSSGYYKFTTQSEGKRRQEDEDELVKEIILKTFHLKGAKKEPNKSR